MPLITMALADVSPYSCFITDDHIPVVQLRSALPFTKLHGLPFGFSPNADRRDYRLTPRTDSVYITSQMAVLSHDLRKLAVWRKTFFLAYYLLKKQCVKKRLSRILISISLAYKISTRILNESTKYYSGNQALHLAGGRMRKFLYLMKTPLFSSFRKKTKELA